MTKVINSPCAASRARVDCLPYSSQSGFINKPSSSQTTHARARTREAHAAIRNPEAYFRAWRMAKFGGDFDPIRVAVEEAVAALSRLGKKDRVFARAVLCGRDRASHGSRTWIAFADGSFGALE